MTKLINSKYTKIIVCSFAITIMVVALSFGIIFGVNSNNKINNVANAAVNTHSSLLNNDIISQNINYTLTETENYSSYLSFSENNTLITINNDNTWGTYNVAKLNYIQGHNYILYSPDSPSWVNLNFSYWVTGSSYTYPYFAQFRTSEGSGLYLTISNGNNISSNVSFHLYIFDTTSSFGCSVLNLDEFGILLYGLNSGFSSGQNSVESGFLTFDSSSQLWFLNENAFSYDSSVSKWKIKDDIYIDTFGLMYYNDNITDDVMPFSTKHENNSRYFYVDAINQSDTSIHYKISIDNDRYITSPDNSVILSSSSYPNYFCVLTTFDYWLLERSISNLETENSTLESSNTSLATTNANLQTIINNSSRWSLTGGWLSSVFSGVGSLLDIDVTDNVNIGDIVAIPLVLMAVMIILKLVRG